MSDDKEELPVVDVEFEGIDSWNRPVFKSASGTRYGSTDMLYSFGEIDKIREEMRGEHLQYFGRGFDCEPHGGVPEKFRLNIVWE